MKIAVYYKSYRNTQIIARAIGKALGVKPIQIVPDMPLPDADILFLGYGIYGEHPPIEVKSFAEQLDPLKVKKIILFTTSGRGIDQTGPFKNVLRRIGLNVADETFCCKGNAYTFVAMGHPNLEDYLEAEEFAHYCVDEEEYEEYHNHVDNYSVRI